jgi:hypothetical protein
MQCYVKQTSAFRALLGESEVVFRADWLAAEYDNGVSGSGLVTQRDIVSHRYLAAKEVHLVHVTPNG